LLAGLIFKLLVLHLLII